MNNNSYDIVIIGSGYRAMVTAFLASKKNQKILIISKTKDLLGIMNPLEWEGGKFDRGYQFFDGINEHQKNIINDFVGKDFLYDFGYGAGSITNNKVYSGHGLPYWPYKGRLFTLKVLVKYIIKYFRKIDKNKINSYEDLVKGLPSEITNILFNECNRRIGLDPSELSYRFEDIPFFNYRQTILPDKISLFLKKNFKYFNELIACKRATLGLDCISLYPKGKYIGAAAEKMQQKLKEKKVDIIDSDGLNISKIEEKNLKISTKLGNISAKKIFIVTELDDALNFFENKPSFKPSVYYLPQIFYYFSTKKIHSNFQYIHGNQENYLTNRANNMSLYGQKTSSSENVISAEVADNKNLSLWKDPEKYVNKVWNEIKQMQLASSDQVFEKYKIFPIKKTVPLPLVAFNQNSETFLNFLEQNFNHKVIFPGLGKRTSRAFFLDEVENEINKYE